MSWLDNLDIHTIHGDLLAIDVEGIVCPVTVRLEDYGKISKRIFTLATPAIQNDLYKLKKSLSENKLHLGESISIDCVKNYGLNYCKKLILTALWDTQSEYNENLFYKAYINSFRQAFASKLKTLALPIMAYDGHLKVSGRAVVKVIQELDSLKTSSSFSVEEAFFVSTNENYIEYFKEEVEPNIF